MVMAKRELARAMHAAGQPLLVENNVPIVPTIRRIAREANRLGVSLTTAPTIWGSKQELLSYLGAFEFEKRKPGQALGVLDAVRILFNPHHSWNIIRGAHMAFLSETAVAPKSVEIKPNRLTGLANGLVMFSHLTGGKPLDVLKKLFGLKAETDDASVLAEVDKRYRSSRSQRPFIEDLTLLERMLGPWQAVTHRDIHTWQELFPARVEAHRDNGCLVQLSRRPGMMPGMQGLPTVPGFSIMLLPPNVPFTGALAVGQELLVRVVGYDPRAGRFLCRAASGGQFLSPGAGKGT